MIGGDLGGKVIATEGGSGAEAVFIIPGVVIRRCGG